MKSQPRVLLFLIAAMGLGPALVEAGVGEIFLLGGFASGSYGTGTESEVTSARVVFNTGDKLQFKVDAGWIGIESPIGVLPGPVGPVPVRHRRASEGSSGRGRMQIPDFVPPESTEVSASGLGDLYLGVSRRIVGGGAKVFRMDGGLEVKVPTADPDEGLGTGEWDARLGLSGEYRFWSATAFGGLGWNYLGDPEWVELQDVVDIYGGVESEPLASRWILSGWLAGNPEVVPGAGSRAIVGLGVRTTGNWRFRLQATAGLTDGAEDFTVLFGVSHGVPTPTVGTRGPRR